MSLPPVYKLKDEHVSTIKHMRDERIRNDTTYKPISTIDSQIRHSSTNTAISCDSSRYISIKSNGNKIADILEDETNSGFTLNTYNKRLNIVSEQPQTHYHNSNTGLFNYKFTGTSDTTTPGYTNYGLLQIAPSNITNLNPAINLISSRVNGLGSTGALYLDSQYGNIQTPLIVSPQTLSDAGGTQMIQYRSTATPVLKTQFQGKSGYSGTTEITEPNQFTSKGWVEAQIAAGTGSGITQAQADVRYYQKIPLNQINVPTNSLSMNGQLIRNVARPQGNNDVATQGYVLDILGQGQGDNISKNYSVDNQTGVLFSLANENIQFWTFQNGNNEVSLQVDADELSTTIETVLDRDLTLSNQNTQLKIKSDSLVTNKKILYNNVTQTYSTVLDNEIIQKICLESRLSDFALTSSLNNYLTLTNAANLYLSQANANTNYLQKNDAESAYLRLNTANAPANLSFPDTFISTKTPTLNQHCVTKLYADNLAPKSLLQNTINAQLQLQTTGNLDLTSGATTFYAIENTDSNVTSNRLTKRRFKMQQLTGSTPMDLFLKNVQNSNGLMLSSGFNDGISTDNSIHPYIGVSSELDNTVTPMLQLNSTNNNLRVFPRMYKTSSTAIGNTDNDEILSKQEIIQLIQLYTGNSYRQGWVQTVNGDLSPNPPSSFTYAGLPISSITHTTFPSMFYWNVTLSQDLGFDYQIYTQLRSNSNPTTNDNDTNIITVQQQNRLQFRITFEEIGQSQQNVRVNILLMPILA